ncbi:MAG: O-antigen ligase family protein [Pirellulaceae bacterium]
MTLLAVLFGIALLVWVALLVRSASLPVAGMAVLLAGAFFGPPFFAIDSLFQISVDRVLWLLLMALFVVHWRLGWTDCKPLNRSDVVLFVLLGWLLIGSQRGGPVPDGSSPLARWLFYFALPAGMYWVARSSPVRGGELRSVLSAFIGFSVYLSIMGICEWQGLHAFVFPRYIVDPSLPEFFGRARGPLLNPAANGVLLTAGLGLVLIRGIEADRLGKVLYGAAAGLICLALYATLTRGVWLGALLAIGAVAAFYVPRWVRVLGLAAALLFGASLALGLKDQVLRLKRDKNLSAAAAEKSIQLRPLLGMLAWEMFKDHPIAGVGYGHYFEHVPRYYDKNSYDMPLDSARGYMQHNVLLSLLVDAGLLGCTLFSIVLLIWTVLGVRLARSRLVPIESRQLGMLTLAMMIGYLFNGMFQDVSVMPMVHMFVFFVAGLTVGVAQRGGVLAAAATIPPTASSDGARADWPSSRQPSPAT